ncbi:heme o synthase [Shewanella surugensis]|uniref:Protoheme IX farnesyltransferase n=1 Tax=Shewanella surugensis TaxID=212020 RepID=A0ABT0LC45_9GAMM|nr:heme o synthase [Shewanella surugensis]MCL1125257.1 heme o synthase [Shewanella surugensis]
MDHVPPSSQHDVMKVKLFLSITKPGIILGNLITVIGSFFLASQDVLNIGVFLLLIVGISCVIASGCVFNNIIDKDIDSVMERTAKRVLVQGLMSDRTALRYALILGGLGFLCLLNINLLSFLFGLIGWFFYVVIYSLWAKRQSVYGTMIGSVSGAMPMAVGYCAGANRIDSGLMILVLISIFWQIPHSYAIGLFRSDDYKKANIPLFSILYENKKVTVHCLLYIVVFTLLCGTLYLLDYAGTFYLLVMMLLCFYWIWLTLRGFYTLYVKKWARSMFVFSIVIISSFSLLIGFNY